VRIRLREDQAVAVALGSVPAEAFAIFVVECEDHLMAIEKDALELEKNPEARDILDSLFRSVHSVKGNAGLLLGHVGSAALAVTHPLQLLLRISHGLESLLDPFRKAAAGPVSAKTIQITLEAGDAIRVLLESLTRDGVVQPISADLLKSLGVSSSAIQSVPATNGKEAGQDAAFLNTTSQCVEMIAGCFHRLESDGQSSAPALATYLRALKTLSSAAQYHQCADLAEPLAQQIKILKAAMTAGAILSTEEQALLAAAFQTVRAVLDRLSPATAGASDAPASPPEGNSSPVPELARNEVPADRPVSAPPSTIRIDQNKLDLLMRIVGELLVARGAFPLLVQKLHDGADGAAVGKDLKEAGSTISRIADELQSSVMAIRMLPVKTVFQRFPRLVRDLARSQGKEVRLIIEGESIELDKTIVEQIGDPLVHLMRNAVDHGLETPADRLAKGKEAAGQLILRAINEAGGVTIEVSDDGRGLDATALKRKAVEKGLLTMEAAAAMSEEEAFQLIFLPGLSTAAKVTDVSGRGVGMDVVRANVRNLQGVIQIRSKPGLGSTLLIKLPASLMVSKGILLQAGTQEYILPLSNIRDMVKLPPQEVHRYRGLTLAQVRGTTYSVFSLAALLGLDSAPSTGHGTTEELSVVIVEAGAVRYGLLVDRFLSEVEVLVKPLNGGLEQCREFQGAAILGDGRVVLVLNALECHRLNREGT
jgi:two-component system chemotaxis sensor kinase CheA